MTLFLSQFQIHWKCFSGRTPSPGRSTARVSDRNGLFLFRETAKQAKQRPFRERFVCLASLSFTKQSKQNVPRNGKTAIQETFRETIKHFATHMLHEDQTSWNFCQKSHPKQCALSTKISGNCFKLLFLKASMNLKAQDFFVWAYRIKLSLWHPPPPPTPKINCLATKVIFAELQSAPKFLTGTLRAVSSLLC